MHAIVTSLLETRGFVTKGSVMAEVNDTFITETDGTVRAQILERQDNPGFYDLIAAFEKITGVGALLNTSFNTHGEPIVNTSDEALSVFLGSEIDGLILPETMILKSHANRL